MQSLLHFFTNTYIDFVELLGKFVDLCIFIRDDYIEFFFFQTLKIESENMSDLKITQGI